MAELAISNSDSIGSYTFTGKLLYSYSTSNTDTQSTISGDIILRGSVNTWGKFRYLSTHTITVKYGINSSTQTTAQVAPSGTFTSSKLTIDKTVASGKSVTITKTHSSQSIPIYLTYYSGTFGVGSLSHNKPDLYISSMSGTNPQYISVGAKTSYTVSYNANGGSGQPGNQTKWYGENLTLSSTKPTRTGYNFSKWNTKSDGTGTNYNSSATYSSNAAATLYAQWTEKTATLTYNANGHGTAPSNVTMKYTTATTAASAITADGWTFVEWNTSDDGTGTSYAPGASVKAANVVPSATTLYAIWIKSNPPVRIKIGGEWTICVPKTKANGSWVVVKKMYTKISGTWHAIK